MSYFQSFSDYNYDNHVADDSSTVYDTDTVIPDEVPSTSSPPMPPLSTLTATATATDYLYNNNVTISSSPHSSQKESPQSFTSVLLRRINSRHRPTVPSTIKTATATAIRSEEIEIPTNESSSSSSSSSKRPITNSSSHQSIRRPRQSSRLKRQQPQDQSYVDKSESEVEGENGLEDYEPDEAVINQSSSISQISTTRQLQNEAKWRSKFQELRVFKQANGHTNTSTHINKQLNNWVNKQRREYKRFKANKTSQITNVRIKTLNSISFEWELSKWNKRFTELSAYKELHGHTNVTLRMKDNKQLGYWVGRQRTDYNKLKANKKSSLTPERIQMLESIGFQWSCRPGSGPR